LVFFWHPLDRHGKRQSHSHDESNDGNSNFHGKDDDEHHHRGNKG